MAKIRAHRDAEAAELARWCLAVTAYLATLSDDPAIDDFSNLVKAALQASSVTRLKSLKRDLTEWGRGLSAEQQRGLDAALRAQTGASFSEAERTDDGLVDKILARGQIRTDDEYRLVSEWLDRTSDSCEPTKIAAVDVLLTRYGVRPS